MAVDTSQIGSVGHLVGASMETAGQFLQSLMLDFFATSNFALGAGVALFVIAAMNTIHIFLFQGHPKGILAFFIGPVLFLFLVFTRTPSTGAKWQYGFRTYTQAPVENAAVSVLGTEVPGLTNL